MKTENSGKESNNGSILILDLNPDSVICPLMFEPQCSLSSGEEEISIGKKHIGRDTRRNIYVLASWELQVVLLWQLSRDANRKQVYKLLKKECTR